MAAKDRFRFETIHRVRKLQEKAQLRELGKLIQEKERSKNHRSSLDRQRKAQMVRLAVLDLHEKNGASLQVGSNRERFLRDRCASVDLVIKDLEDLIEKKRKMVEKAFQDKKVFDLLFDKHMQNVRLRMRRESDKEMDELAVTRFGKNGDDMSVLRMETKQ